MGIMRPSNIIFKHVKYADSNDQVTVSPRQIHWRSIMEIMSGVITELLACEKKYDKHKSTIESK